MFSKSPTSLLFEFIFTVVLVLVTSSSENSIDYSYEELTSNEVGQGLGNLQTKTENWPLIFNDEFSGSFLDRTKWEYQSGCDETYGKRNQQCYVGGTNNVKVKNGMLIITAKIQDDGPKHFTSGRIRQLGNGTIFGKYVLRARLPAGARLWPALWLKSKATTCYHEIDILEMMGENPSRPIFTAYYGLNHDYVVRHGAAFETTSQFNENFHIFQLIWTPEFIAWYVDEEFYFQVPLERPFWEAPFTLTCSAEPFSVAQDLIINLAVGGSMYNPKQYDILTPEMARQNWTKPTLEIDYIRVYQYKE